MENPEEPLFSCDAGMACIYEIGISMDVDQSGSEGPSHAANEEARPDVGELSSVAWRAYELLARADWDDVAMSLEEDDVDVAWLQRVHAIRDELRQLSFTLGGIASG